MLKSLWSLLRNKEEQVIPIIGTSCYIKPFMPADAKALTQLLINNKDYWTIYEPKHIDSYYTEYTQYKKLQDSLRLRSLNQEHSFGIYELQSNRLIGQISLYAIRPLPFLSCFIGYSIDESFIGRGITTEAVALAIRFAFNTLNLNRIDAYVSPKNKGSMRVLEKAGFQKEGYLKDLLYVNGRWEDHYLYAILKKDYLT